MSHELRTPLNSIIVSNLLLQEERLPAINLLDTLKYFLNI
jgi:signal transduction histidine kinase